MSLYLTMYTPLPPDKGVPNQKQRITPHTCILQRFPISENIDTYAYAYTYTYTYTVLILVLVVDQLNSEYVDTARCYGHLS
jgi:hypothetical protein